ncbi:MAG: hypothetical protein LBG63_01090, partial [Candidatus Methanoplasma sp.]|nr:hypothetical protein [Candidatus Methanoplasma sp.]
FRKKSLIWFLNSLTNSYEGKVKAVDFTIETLEQYQNNLRSIPAFREILSAVIENFDYLNYLEVSNNQAKTLLTS